MSLPPRKRVGPIPTVAPVKCNGCKWQRVTASGIDYCMLENMPAYMCREHLRTGRCGGPYGNPRVTSPPKEEASE